MWRIHFTGDDLTRLRVAAGADPMWELLMSVHLAGSRAGGVVFDPWRRKRLRHGRHRWRPLSALAPPVGYSPDFLTPLHGTTELHAGIESIMSSPRQLLRHDLGVLGGQVALPSWAHDLAAGDPAVLRQLGRAMRGYFNDMITPHWHHVRRQVDEERHRLARAMATGGIERLLSTVSPLLRWESPVLLMTTKIAEHDIILGGRGVVLQPSFFAFGDVTPAPAVVDVGGPVARRDAPLTLVYPVRHELGWATLDPPTEGRLRSLLGRTRAEALDALADAPCTTTELARRLGMSLASASQQAKVLREAGLVASVHEGKAVVHSASTLGIQLLEGRPGV